MLQVNKRFSSVHRRRCSIASVRRSSRDCRTAQGSVGSGVDVRIGELDLDVRDIEAILLGETFDGTPIRGADPVEFK